MRKNLLVLLLTISMVFSLVACGNKEEAQTTADTTAATTDATAATTPEAAVTQAVQAADATDDGIVIGWLQKNQSNYFETVINAGGEAILKDMKASGQIKEYYLLDGQTDASIQVNQASDLINLGVDAVIMQPAEADGSAPVVDIMNEAGIPIVLVNSLTSNSDKAQGVSASNDVEAGEILGQFVLDQAGDTGKYCHLQGIIGNTAAIQRTEGIHNIMDAATGWTMLEEQSAEWQGDKASKFTQDWISLYGKDLNAILCDNDDMAVACRLACLEAGREDIIVIGVDATSAALEMVNSGELAGTVFQDGTNQGAEAVKKAIALAKGEEIQRETWIPFQLVTSENIDQFYKK